METLRHSDATGQQENTSSSSSLALVRSLLMAFAAGDIDAAAHFLTDDVHVTANGPGDLAGSYDGPDAWVRYATSLRALGNGSYHAVELDALVGTDHAALVLRASVHAGTPNEIGWRRLATYRIAGGRIAEIWLIDLDGEDARRAMSADGAVP